MAAVEHLASAVEALQTLTRARRQESSTSPFSRSTPVIDESDPVRDPQLFSGAFESQGGWARATMAAAAFVAVVAWAMWPARASEKYRQAMPTAVAALQSGAAGAAKIAAPDSAEIAAPDVLPASKRDEPDLHLDIRPTGECWVSAKADGQPVLNRLIHSGEHETVLARDAMVLRIGDPEPCAYTINGVSGRPLGKSGRPVTVEITESNYQTFFASSEP